MINNKKAFQLSINMIVVLILGLTMLSVGISIFYNAYNKTVDLKENVDSQTQRQLNELLDTGEAIVVPISTKDGNRGEFVDFDLGISNELGDSYAFYVFIRYSGFSSSSTMNLGVENILTRKSCRLDDINYDKRNCADKWILIPRESSQPDKGFENDRFILKNNERYSLPIRIVLPKKVSFGGEDVSGLPSGQFIFNVDVYKSFVGDSSNIPTCDPSNSPSATCTPYFGKKKLYVKLD